MCLLVLGMKKTIRMMRMSRTRKRIHHRAASTAIFFGVVALFSFSTVRIAGPGWAQKRHEKAKGKEEEMDQEEKK